MQVLFSPLLAAMGLESVRMSALMKELGGSLSMRGSLSSVRVKIVDSDFSVTGRHHNDMSRGKASYIVLYCIFLHLVLGYCSAIY